MRKTFSVVSRVTRVFTDVGRKNVESMISLKFPTILIVYMLDNPCSSDPLIEL